MGRARCAPVPVDRGGELPGSHVGGGPGGHGDVLRGSRGEAAGIELGSSFVERITVNAGTALVLPACRVANWAKRQAVKAGVEFTELSNGFATCTDPAALQAICDRLGPGAIRVFAERWWSMLPLPLTEHDRAAGYWWELSMRQIETSRTLVFDAPRRARGFFEALAR